MNTQRPNSQSGLSTLGYLGLIAVFAVFTVGVVLLYQNIGDRKAEATQDVFRVAEMGEDAVDPALWAKIYPRQYESYRRTVDMVRTRHGGSEAFQHLDATPGLRRIFAGNPFSVDYREERGHAFMLADQRATERVHQFKQPGACLHCHSSSLHAYVQAGIKAGVPEGMEHWEAQIQKGFEIICAMPYAEANKLVEHPVSCIDCHNPKTMALRVNRPGFVNAIRALAESDYPTPHLPSIERWRKGPRDVPFNANKEASRQEMRSMVCAQCHVEYYFKGPQRLVTFPWNKGLKSEQMLAHYDEIGFRDFVHKETGALSLKVQHPEFELWSQGSHARAGVSCADCHMPYVREGAIKVSSHHTRSPLLQVSQSCQTCHRGSEEELKERAIIIQDRTKDLLKRSEKALVGLLDAIVAAQKAGTPEALIKTARDFQRKSQWRFDYIKAENSMGFHAPQEAARILGEAIDYARQGEIALGLPPAAPAPATASAPTAGL